jgi:outer membrane lipoprotein SlyB
VIGRFESDRGGSQFITQAVSLRGRNVPFAAKSTSLDGKLQISEDKVVKHSALGAIAGALVGGVSGGDILGGAAAGAAVTYLTAPKPATLQPGQLIQVQVTEDLR